MASFLSLFSFSLFSILILWLLDLVVGGRACGYGGTAMMAFGKRFRVDFGQGWLRLGLRFTRGMVHVLLLEIRVS